MSTTASEKGKPRWMIAARSGAATCVTDELAVLPGERAQVGAALDGREGREHAHPARVRDGGGDLGFGLDHGDDLNPVLGGEARAASSPALAAELHAITISFAPRSSRKRVFRSTHSERSSRLRAP